MIDALRQGFVFGANSGIITTTGVITGLVQTNISRLFLIVSVISLAISDSISEGYGMYLSKKAQNITDNSNGPLYALISLMVIKFLVVISFLIPLLFTKDLKVYKNMSWVLCWAIFLLIILDYQLSIMRNESIWNYIIPHIGVLLFVIFLTKYFGNMIDKLK
jgi:VIT1/CCC1 family predicted Fe2+/Mn2+ transporter